MLMTVRRSAFVIYSATPTLKNLPINASTGQTFGKKLEGRQKGRVDQSALLLLTRQMPVYGESENYPFQSGFNGEIARTLEEMVILTSVLKNGPGKRRVL